jgi:hypothetical protein
MPLPVYASGIFASDMLLLEAPISKRHLCLSVVAFASFTNPLIPMVPNEVKPTNGLLPGNIWDLQPHVRSHYATSIEYGKPWVKVFGIRASLPTHSHRLLLHTILSPLRENYSITMPVQLNKYLGALLYYLFAYVVIVILIAFVVFTIRTFYDYGKVVIECGYPMMTA